MWKHSISGNVFIVFDGEVNFCELYELKEFSQFNIVWDLTKYRGLRIKSHLGHDDIKSIQYLTNLVNFYY